MIIAIVVAVIALGLAIFGYVDRGCRWGHGAENREGHRIYLSPFDVGGPAL